MSLTIIDLVLGQTGTVAGFSRDDEMTERLMQLGIVEGADIRLIRYAPSGDPLEIDVMGYALSLRKSEARTVLIDPSSADE